MECLLGIACKDFVMIAADTTVMQSILIMKSDEQKIYKMSDSVIMGVIGNAGDTVQFAEYIAKNIQLYKMRNGYHLSPASAAHYTRHNLAEYLRSQNPYMVNLLMGGYDKEEGGQLYYIDYLASSQKVPFGAHGYGGIFAVSIMDRYYRPDMSIEEAYDVLKMCIAEIHKRLVINLTTFNVQVVTAQGIKELKPIVIEVPTASA